jgi:hypothetical protein
MDVQNASRCVYQNSKLPTRASSDEGLRILADSMPCLAVDENLWLVLTGPHLAEHVLERWTSQSFNRVTLARLAYFLTWIKNSKPSSQEPGLHATPLEWIADQCIPKEHFQNTSKPSAELPRKLRKDLLITESCILKHGRRDVGHTRTNHLESFLRNVVEDEPRMLGGR